MTVTSGDEKMSFGGPRVREPPGATLTLPNLAITCARYWRLLAGTSVTAGVLTAVVVLIVPNSYTAAAAFIAENRSASIGSQLSTLAALTGVNLSSAPATQSPQFYAAVIRTRGIQAELLQRRFPATFLDPTRSPSDSLTLLEALGVRGRTPEERMYYGAKKLNATTAVAVDIRTGIVRVSFTCRSAPLASAVTNAYADAINRFNRQTRMLQARARREFVEQRVEEVGSELRDAESAARDFLVRNRRYQDSPSLLFEYQRLQRAVGLQQDLYVDLRRQLDAARIAEVDDTPTLTIVEQAVPPQIKAGPARKKWVLGMTFVSFILVLGALVLVDYGQELVPGLMDALHVLQTHRASRRT